MFSLQAWFHPKPYFRSLRPSAARAWAAYALASLVPALILTPFAALFLALFRLPSTFLLLIPAAYLAGLVLVFAYAALLHGLSRLLGSRSSYSLTFVVLARGAVPFLLLSWVPLANLLGLVAAGRAIAIGLHIRCRMQEDNALLATILTGCILAGLSYLAYLAVVLLYFPAFLFPAALSV